MKTLREQDTINKQNTTAYVQPPLSLFFRKQKQQQEQDEQPQDCAYVLILHTTPTYCDLPFNVICLSMAKKPLQWKPEKQEQFNHTAVFRSVVVKLMGSTTIKMGGCVCSSYWSNAKVEHLPGINWNLK